MACDPTLGFKNVAHFGVSGPSSKLEKNLQYFIDYGFLLAGGWVDIKIGFPGPNGEDASELMLVDCFPSASGYPVRQGFRSNWVHESGIVYTDLSSTPQSPIIPSIGGNINYRYGYVENPDNTNAEYSAKQVNVLIGNEEDWWKEIQLNSWNVPEDFINKGTCGVWSIGSQNRVQLPVVIIELIDSGDATPRGLGECCRYLEIPINLYILSDIKCDRQNISDILIRQLSKTFSLFDPDFAEEPLDCNGFINPSGMSYADLINNYGWGCARVKETESRGFTDINYGLYEGVVRWTLEVYPDSCL